MVAAPLSYSTRSKNGPRPINLRKDIPQVLALLNLVFSSSLDSDGRRVLNRMSLAQQPWVVLQLRQLVEGIVPGFVWEESGEIVGNVSLLTTGRSGRYLVANVAVHPDFRRRGIARMLMEEVIDLVERHKGNELLLQVHRDNLGAIALYKKLDFKTVGSVTSWYTSYNQFRLLPLSTSNHSPDRIGDLFIRPLRGREWLRAWRLDQSSMAPDLNWPEPLPRDAYKQGFGRWLSNLFAGRQAETWVVENADEELVGLGTILTEWGRAHGLSIRVHPDWQGKVERPLMAKLLRRLQYMARRNIRMDHPADDVVINDLLREANFHPRRTLTVMRLDV
jgi:ribosomal protein S18 acetylase RimI-like enzyme